MLPKLRQQEKPTRLPKKDNKKPPSVSVGGDWLK